MREAGGDGHAAAHNSAGGGNLGSAGGPASAAAALAAAAAAATSGGTAEGAPAGPCATFTAPVGPTSRIPIPRRDAGRQPCRGAARGVQGDAGAHPRRQLADDPRDGPAPALPQRAARGGAGGAAGGGDRGKLQRRQRRRRRHVRDLLHPHPQGPQAHSLRCRGPGACRALHEWHQRRLAHLPGARAARGDGQVGSRPHAVLQVSTRRRGDEPTSPISA
mmetsp:Transcript_44847/g.138980  ORF Transcript_44847/g.138980 Transcript_44847/m.138980 type:complete len:219 (+) Transcript_44847:1062-1718(+)